MKTEFENELYAVLSFWQKFSIDTQNGGYYNCLDREGHVFDTTKYMWLHGRQIWMFSKLFNTLSPENEWLTIARHGLDFMRTHANAGNGRLYFSLNESGRPVYMQRKIFTECFYAMALAEYGRAIGSQELLAESKQVFETVWSFSKDASLVGRPSYSGETKFQTLAVPMILLNVMEEVYGDEIDTVSDKIADCIHKVKKHFINHKVYENVLPDGTRHDSAHGRLLNPGHAIEAGWFLKHWAARLNDASLNQCANDMISASFDNGWDTEYGGLYYFIDADGHSPLQLEWDMKLWWPHCEAMYAFLLIYSESRDSKDWELFQRVKEYAFTHFSDKKYGEWFGYLNRMGDVSLKFKGGPYKGCFHVPRALFLCLKLFDQLND